MNVIETMISSSARNIDKEISSEAGKTSLLVSLGTGSIHGHVESFASLLTRESAADASEATIGVPDFTGEFRIIVVVNDGKKTATEHVYFTVLPDNSETAVEAADSISLEPDMFIGSRFDPFTSLWPTWPSR